MAEPRLPKFKAINPAIKQANPVMPDLIWHPVTAWIPAFAGMTTLMYLVAGAIIKPLVDLPGKNN